MFKKSEWLYKQSKENPQRRIIILEKKRQITRWAQKEKRKNRSRYKEKKLIKTIRRNSEEKTLIFNETISLVFSLYGKEVRYGDIK